MTEVLTKEFSLMELLGAISGYLLEDQGFARIQELIEWVVGNPVFTHQIPSVAPYVQRNLVKQFSQFDLDADSWLADRVTFLVTAIKNSNPYLEESWKRELKDRYGNSFQVAPMQAFDELKIAPLIPEGAIVVKVDGDSFPDNL